MNGKPYIVGELRACADCGKEFPREIHRRAYCEVCRRRRNRESMARHAKTRVHGNYRGKLPGGTHLTYEGMPNYVMRKTKVAHIPTCPVCHHYGMCSEHQKVVYG